MTKHDKTPSKTYMAEGTDKVVPYWSSHLDGAVSEKIVDASHVTITPNPNAIAEVRRILYLHIERKAPAVAAAALQRR